MRTIEEAAKSFWYEQSTGISDVDHESIFRNGAEFAQRWIPVEEELPINEDLVLVKTNLGSICTAYLHGEISGFITYGDDAFIEFGEITHWRPIEVK